MGKKDTCKLLPCGRNLRNFRRGRTACKTAPPCPASARSSTSCTARRHHESWTGCLNGRIEGRPHGALQDERCLRNDANLGPEVLPAKVGDVRAIDEDLALRAFDDAEERQKRRALSRARAADDAHLVPLNTASKSGR